LGSAAELKKGMDGSKGMVGSGFFLLRLMILILLRSGAMKSSSMLIACFSRSSQSGKGKMISSKVRGL
jgi:hypothetical protein